MNKKITMTRVFMVTEGGNQTVRKNFGKVERRLDEAENESAVTPVIHDMQSVDIVCNDEKEKSKCKSLLHNEYTESLQWRGGHWMSVFFFLLLSFFMEYVETANIASHPQCRKSL